MAKTTEIENNTINLIGVGTDIQGDITSNGDLRIDGTLKGNIKTQGKIVVGSSGFVKGEIQCKNADIEGKVEGKVVINELLTLKSTSVITGDIQTKRLAIEPGSKFTGNCDMSGGASAFNSKTSEAEKDK